MWYNSICESINKYAINSKVDLYNKTGLIIYIPEKKLFSKIESLPKSKEDVQYLLDILDLTCYCVYHDSIKPALNTLRSANPLNRFI